MSKMGSALLVIYLILIAIISVWFAAVTLTIPGRPACKVSEARPDLTPDEREWCRRRRW
jgi:hypothetical protein